MDLTPKQQTSEAIRQAETILIITGQHPTIDQTAAVIALSAILRKFGKQTTAIISDNTPAATQLLDTSLVEKGLGGQRDFVLKVDVSKAEVDKLRYEVQDEKLNIHLTPFKGGFAPSDVTFGYGSFHYDLAIVLGVPNRGRIDRIYEQNIDSFNTIPIVNLDFHRSNENYGAVNLIEPNASSLCEMLVALSESLQGGIVDGDIASALLMGIVGSTDRFTAAHTSPKSLTVAAQMMAAGAKHAVVMRALYRDNKAESRGGNDRGGRNADKNDRGNDRSGRNEKGGADRNENNLGRGGSQPNQERPQPSPVRTQPVQERPQAQPAPAPEQAPAPVGEASQVRPAEVAPAQHSEAPVAGEEAVIIPPSHIEMSAEVPAQPLVQPAPQAPVTSAAQAMVSPPQAPSATHVALTQNPEVQPSAPQSAPVAPAPADRPPAMPMADFAAAAEMFGPVTSQAEARKSHQE